MEGARQRDAGVTAALLRHRAHASWDFVRIVGEVAKFQGWAGSATSLQTGLRGSGQCVRGPSSFRYIAVASERWTSLSWVFDARLTAAAGSDELVGQVGLSTGGPIQLRRDTGGKLYLTDVATSQTWTSNLALATNAVYQVELLACLLGGGDDYARVRVNGYDVPSLRLYGINLTDSGQAQAAITEVRWTNANEDVDAFALFVGVGGFNDADLRTNPTAILKCVDLAPTANGRYSDGTDEAGHSTRNNWQHVDEAISNTSDWIGLTLLSNKESYTFTELTGNGTPTSVVAANAHFYASTRSGTAGQTVDVAFWRQNSRESEYFESLASGYSSDATFDQYWTATWRKNPATGSQLTVADVDGAEVGWRRGDSAGSTRYVSNVVLEVLYYDGSPASPASFAPTSLLQQKTHRRASLWKIEPIGSAPIFLTDHSSALIVGGVTYSPSGGFTPSAESRLDGLAERDQEYVGVLRSDVISVDDLRAGRFRGARVYKMLVDWLVPELGAIMESSWTIESTKHDGERWTGTVSGLQSRMLAVVGDAFGVRCRANLFDNDLPGTRPDYERLCKLDAQRYVRTFDVTAVTDRRVFAVTVNGTPSLGRNFYDEGWFAGGRLMFTTGANAGLVGEIRNDTVVGTFELYVPLAMDVQVGDLGMCWAGCNHLIGTFNHGDCKSKFNLPAGNVPNFAGQPWIVGTDSQLRGADQ